MKFFWYFLLGLVWLNTEAQISDFDHVDFTKADSIAYAYQGENLKNLPDLAHKLTNDLDTEVEKFRAIYLWVCTNVANDYRLFLKNKKKREKYEGDSLKLDDWNEKFKVKLFSKLRKRKKTICSGYSYILSELSKLSNINCVMVNGFGRTSTTTIDNYTSANHSWNAVRLNRKWYLCDATWASGIVHPFNYGFKFNYNNGLFLTEPEFFALTHFPIESKWMLLQPENTPSFDEFLNNPIMYGTAYKNLEGLVAPKKMHHNLKKNETLSFQYDLLEETNSDIVLILDNGFRTETVKPQNIKMSGKQLFFDYTFKSKGFYDVHFSIGNDLIATYTVRVEN